MKKNRSLLILVTVLFFWCSCKVQVTIYFNEDFSGVVKLTADANIHPDEIDDGVDTDHPNGWRDSLTFLVSSGKEVPMKNYHHQFSDSNVYLSFEFENPDHLNQALRFLMYGSDLSPFIGNFSLENKELKYVLMNPSVVHEDSVNLSQYSITEVEMALHFPKPVYRTSNAGYEISADEKSVSIKKKLLFFSDQKTMNCTIKLK